jgi:predicted kinase
MTSPGDRQTATIVCGNAGVGKTTYARTLAGESGALLLDIDTVSETLVRAGLSALGHDPDDRDSPQFKQIYREAIHETLLKIADENLGHAPCVIVAPFTRERRDANFLSRVQDRLRTEVHILYVWCDDATRKQRIIARESPRDASKLADWESYRRRGQEAERPLFPYTLVDTSS